MKTNRSPFSDDESAICEFVISSKKERVRSQIESCKNRSKFLRSLPHFTSFDQQFIQEIPADKQNPFYITQTLINMGARENCYLVSASKKLDQKILPLAEAVEMTVAIEPGTVISCIPGKLAYYEGEHRKDRYILRRD